MSTNTPTNSKCLNKNNSIQRPATLHLETLESRRLLSATVTKAGVWLIDADDDTNNPDDYITIQLTPDDPQVLQVVINDEIIDTQDIADIRGLRILAGKGNDMVTIDLDDNNNDIRAEVLGTKGTLKIGYLRETPILVMTKEGVRHDVVPHFMERFGEAYFVQIQNFVNNVIQDKPPTITIGDGIAALQICIAATKSFKENRPIEVEDI